MRGRLLSWRGLACFLVACIVASPVLAAPSGLREYEQRRYAPWERKHVAGVVAEVFPGASAAEREQAVRECLAFSYVVYQRTGSHRFENNVAVMAKWHQVIDDACDRYQVPRAMARSILAWENSGGETATSWAACTGMGQLSRGAMGRAHIYGQQLANQGDGMLGLLCGLGGLTAARLVGSGGFVVAALEQAARRFRAAGATNEIAERHERMRVAAKVEDERVLPRCNIEDSVLYMRYLLDMYGDRPDLAISAYHNGVGNTDDLLKDWFARNVSEPVQISFQSREPLAEALRRHHVTYLALWNDPRSRKMLNGLLTMDGEPTTAANAREALGDESDIYVWKTMSAAAGLSASPQELAQLLKRYEGPQDEAETRAFTPAARSLRNLPGGIRVVAEMAEYIRSVRTRFKQRTGRECPLRLVRKHATPPHVKGVAVDIVPGHPEVRRILKEDWLFDRIFKRNLPGGVVHVCLNPREAEALQPKAAR